MSRALCRFEILLPLKFNDGSAVPPELAARTVLELREKFGAPSRAKRKPFKAYGSTGARRIAGRTGPLVHRRCGPAGASPVFAEYKEVLKSRFQQIDIWMVTFPSTSFDQTQEE
jgi:hypothetical protein